MLKFFQSIQRPNPTLARGHNSKNALLNLPVELILSIMDYLPLHNQILLSQTSSRLLKVLYARCTKSMIKLTVQEYRALHCAIGDLTGKPHYFVCPRCRHLHQTSRQDTPEEYGTGDLTKKQMCYIERAPICSYTLYNLEQRHVHLAVRYWNNRSQSSHLAGILKPFEGSMCTRDLDDGNTHIWQEQYFEPRIIEGRFIMYSRRRVVAFEDRFHLRRDVGECPTEEQVEYIKICPHLVRRNREYHAPGSYDRFSSDLHALYTDTSDHVVMKGSCKRCPTDYDIVKKGGYLLVHIWQDYGNGEYTDAPGWEASVWGQYDERGVKRTARDNGSVRELWEHGGRPKVSRPFPARRPPRRAAPIESSEENIDAVSEREDDETWGILDYFTLGFMKC